MKAKSQTSLSTLHHLDLCKIRESYEESLVTAENIFNICSLLYVFNEDTECADHTQNIEGQLIKP